MSLKQQIIDYVNKHKDVTLIDLDNAGIAGFNGTTPFTIKLPDTNEEKLVWYLSPEAIKAIGEIWQDHSLTVFGAFKGSKAYYEKAGKTLPNDNWFPLVFNAKA